MAKKWHLGTKIGALSDLPSWKSPRESKGRLGMFVRAPDALSNDKWEAKYCGGNSGECSSRFRENAEAAKFLHRRGMEGAPTGPKEACPVQDTSEAACTSSRYRQPRSSCRARVKVLLEDGMTVREIADESGIPRSTVGRLKQAIEATAKETGTKDA